MAAKPKSAKKPAKPAPVGYSGKSLIDKLGLKPGMTAIAVNAPIHYADLVDGAPITPRASLPKSGAFDFIHLFVKDRAALEAAAPKLDPLLAEGGMIWISWPKKTSAFFKDLTEDGIRSVILPPGKLVDVKVAAVDNDWSGLKLYRRKK
ncbi:MAG TPA: hypothetical protein VGO52_11615 [Hyphomonadaceae bacterium]|jgi:hypothetical protein|nr:hypothetical protein [Hyphomonadaceae bacterium]